MAISQEMKLVGGIAAVSIVGLWLMSRRSSIPTHSKDVYLPSDQIRVWQGTPFTMKLPAGQWQSLSSELQIMTQAQYGNSTLAQVIAVAAPADYVATAIFSRTDDPRVQESFTVHARRPV